MNKKNLYTRICVLLLALTVSVASLANTHLNKSAAAFAQAMMKFDYKVMAVLSHPRIVKARGGVEKYSALLARTFDAPRKSGLRFTRLQFGKIHDLKRYGKLQIATVPYTMTVVNGGKKTPVSSFYYAFSGSKGVAWFFLDCNGGSLKVLKALVNGYDDKLKKPGKC